MYEAKRKKLWILWKCSVRDKSTDHDRTGNETKFDPLKPIPSMAKSKGQPDPPLELKLPRPGQALGPDGLVETVHYMMWGTPIYDEKLS